MEPIFEHDCDSCKYMGTHMDHDMYFCPQGGLYPTVVARFGHEPDEYLSGIFENETPDMPLGFALKLAKDLKLI